MKYLEELSVGESFQLNNEIFILTSDFKKNGEKSCVNLSNGLFRWITSNTIVEICPTYILDKDNNIIAIKPTVKNESN